MRRGKLFFPNSSNIEKSAASGDRDDLQLISVGEITVGEFRGRKGFLIELHDDRFPIEAQLGEERLQGEGGLEDAGFSVNDKSHDEVRMAGSQSFQTGSKPWDCSKVAISETVRLSSISNCPVARSQEVSSSSSTRRPLTVRWRSSVPAPV